MAYEISSSVAAGNDVSQFITASAVNGFERGGRFSPDGSKLAVNTYRRAGAGSTDYGIDIFQSSSANGWAVSSPAESIDTTTLPTFITWLDDRELFTTEGNFLRLYRSGSASGWAEKGSGVAHTADPYHQLNPGKTLLATWGGSSTNDQVMFFASGSTDWTNVSNINLSLTQGAIQGLTWIDDDTIVLGQPTYNTDDGRLYVYKTSDNGSTWALQETLTGDGGTGGDAYGIGTALYYHSASGGLIVTCRENTTFTEDVKNKILLYQSSSASGFLPSSYATNTVISDASRRPLNGGQVRPHPSNGDIVLMTEATNGGIGAELYVFESGSEGWKITLIDNAYREPAGQSTIDISVNMDVVHDNNVAETSGQASIFKVTRLRFPPPPGIQSTTTSSITAAAGGLAKAGNVSGDPDAQVNIPAGALSGDTSVVVKIKQTLSDKAEAVSEIKALASVPKGARAVSDIVAFEPHGTSFSSDAILSWNVTGSTSNVKIYRRANPSSAWAEVDPSYYSFNGGQVHVTSSTFSEYMAVGGITSVAITRIGTKLISDGAITTVKLGSSAVTRSDIQSGSVQVTHLDVTQGQSGHVDFLNDDFLIAGDVTNNDARGFSFSQLKTALSLSNAARGDEGTVQYNDGSGFDGIAKIRTDGIHLTASDAGKVVFAFTGISGSTGEIFADSKTGLTVNAKTTLSLNINGADELEVNATVAQPAVNEGLNLGASDRKYNEVYANVFSGSGTSQIHKLDIDELTVNRFVQSDNTSAITGSGTANLHNLTVEEGTFGGVKFSSVRDAAAYALSGSGTASIHKLDADEGDFRKVILSVVTGSGTSQIHKVDADLGTIDRVSALVVTGSGTSQFHKVDVDEGTHNKVITTNITGSGLTQLHNLTAGDVSGSIGEFHHMNVDHVTARVINSTTDTVEHLEVNVKQLIPAVSQSAGAAQEGAGLQIGGAAGSGSSGIASVILGDAGSGAGADLLFKIGATQGASLSGSVSDGGQRFGVSGTLSASIGVFHDIEIAKSLGAQDSIFSGSSFNAQTISGSLARIFDVDVNGANIRDVDGTSATFTTVSGTTVQAHTADTDKLTANDVDGVSMTITGIVSGSTVDAHTIDVDKLEVRDLDFTNLSGSATATIHKVTSDVLSGSATTLHSLDVDKLAINSITTNDVVKKAQLNNNIVKATSNAHGGLVFANGQLSVGHKRRIFSRSTKALINRTQPTQGSGSLYTTCSLGGIQMVSGSEMVYFNGLLLTKDNGQDGGNPKDGDYKVSYQSGADNGVIVFLSENLAMDSDDVVVVQYLSGSHQN